MKSDESLDVLLTHLHSWPSVRRGGERYLHELAAGLVRAGHGARVVSTSPNPGRGAVEGVPVRWLRARSGPKRYGKAGPEVAFAAAAWVDAQRHHTDVWHALGTADAAAATLGTPWARPVSVYTDLGIPDRAWREERPDRGLHRRVVAKVGAYLTLSEHAAGLLQSGFGRTAVVAPGGIRLNGFAPGSRDGRPTLLYAGTLSEPRKNVLGLLRAAVRLQRDVRDLQVWLSGPGDARELIDAVPGSAVLVTRAALDSREDLEHLYASAWVTVLASVDEAQGLTVIESLASGTPVVVRRDGGGPPELVDADCAVVAEPGDDGLAAALSEALELSQGGFVVAACRARAALYDWDTVIVPRLVGVYQGLASD